MEKLEEIQKAIEQIRINNLKGMTQIEVDDQLYKLEIMVFKAMDLVKENDFIGGVMLTNDSDKNEKVINRSDLSETDKNTLQMANSLIKGVQPLIDIIKNH